MQVIVTGRHTDVPDALKDHAVRKLSKVERFSPRIQTLEIEFSEEHNPRVADRHAVEVTVTTRAHLVRATASAPDPASAVDMVVGKLESQLKRLKDKRTRRGNRSDGGNRTGNGQIPRTGGAAADTLESESEEDDSERRNVTRIVQVEPKPMTTEEAILQMESLGHDFFLFVSAETGGPGVVYRRRNGSYGLIETG